MVTLAPLLGWLDPEIIDGNKRIVQTGRPGEKNINDGGVTPQNQGLGTSLLGRDQLTGDQLFGDQLTGDQLTGDQFNVGDQLI